MRSTWPCNWWGSIFCAIALGCCTAEAQEITPYSPTAAMSPAGFTVSTPNFAPPLPGPAPRPSFDSGVGPDSVSPPGNPNPPAPNYLVPTTTTPPNPAAGPYAFAPSSPSSFPAFVATPTPSPPSSQPTIVERPTESSWYTRIDYFHWNERIAGQDFVNEYGPLYTLGYQRRTGPERFRGEFFGSNVKYHGGVQFNDGTSDPLVATTNYMGGRLEYDLLFEPDFLPELTFFLGGGTRFWFRDLLDATSFSGYQSLGYQETWWTIYPYLGVERRRKFNGGVELYGMSRLGITPVNYQHVSFLDVTFHPKMGMNAQMEVGIRSQRLFLSAFFESMNWGASGVARDSFQPSSLWVTIGLRTGFTF